MNSPALIAAMRTACRSPLNMGPGLGAATLMQLGYLCLALFTALGSLVHRTSDPRLILAHSDLVGKFAQQLHRDQLTLALDAEVTGAHALSVDTYTALRQEIAPDGYFDQSLFTGEPQVIQGRPCYKDTAELLAAWHGITYVEASRRIHDAHLLIGRRTPEGTICAPRLPHLAALYHRGCTDRRAITSTARRLEKLEPEDTTFEGRVSNLVALGPDGRTLDESAAHSLQQHGPLEAAKQISTEIRIYKDLNGQKLPPKLGLFIGRVINGVHCFHLRTDAIDAQLIRSVATRAGNPRTKSGRADPEPQQQRDDQTPAGGTVPEANDETQSECATDTTEDTTNQNTGTGTPDWLRSDQPMPPWAADESATEHREDSSTNTTEEPSAEESSAEVSSTEANGDNVEPDAADKDLHSDQGQPPDINVRRLNALMALLAAPYVGGKRKVVVPKFIVYLWLADLQNMADAHGMTANGVDIPPGELRQLLATAEIIPVVLGGNSQPLDMGRKMRYHKGPMREAIMARDRGCIVPDCTAPPDHVETDHYETPWSEGGETSVWSGAGMCTPDHHKRHAGQIKVVEVEGLPHVILPEHIDPEQKPRRNTYWDARQAGESPTRNQPPAGDKEPEDPPSRPGQEPA